MSQGDSASHEAPVRDRSAGSCSAIAALPFSMGSRSRGKRDSLDTIYPPETDAYISFQESRRIRGREAGGQAGTTWLERQQAIFQSVLNGGPGCPPAHKHLSESLPGDWRGSAAIYTAADPFQTSTPLSQDHDPPS